MVESWLPDYALFNAVEEFKHGRYKFAIAIGPTLPYAGDLSRYPTAAEAAAAKLVELGLPRDRVIAVASGAASRDRTYSSGIAIKRWLETKEQSVKSLDVYSLGPHARRSRLLFQKALGNKVKVGVLASPDMNHDPERWWATSDGVKTVTSEGLAYIYARVIFPLLPHNSDNPINPNQHFSGVDSSGR